VGDQVLLRVSPTRGVVRFGVLGKLNPRYIGPFSILASVGSLAYCLQLLESMAGVHPVFHVSMLRKHLRDPDHQIELEPIAVQQDLTLECRSVRILESSERVMRRRTIKYVKVLWTNQSERDATWELEELMRQKYLELFVIGEFLSSPIFLVVPLKALKFEVEFLLRGQSVIPKFYEKKLNFFSSSFVLCASGVCSFGRRIP
jgi:hypothetical protein